MDLFQSTEEPKILLNFDLKTNQKKSLWQANQTKKHFVNPSLKMSVANSQGAVFIASYLTTPIDTDTYIAEIKKTYTFVGN